MNERGLRLVVFDATGHGKSWFQPFLTASWRIGVGLYGAYPNSMRVDASFGAHSWTDALAWLASVQPHEPIAEIQYWGHGLPGRVMVADDVFDTNTIDGAFHDDVDAIAARMTPRSLLWLRTCGAFGGEQGHSFARTLVARFRCRVAGHTFVIGPLQSGLHSLSPGQTPSWSPHEGQQSGKLQPSTWTAPNTITCLQGKIPTGW